MNERRGLTLVEVVAATVLLAVIATTCLPVLSHSMRQLDAAAAVRGDFGIGDLAIAADMLLADAGALDVLIAAAGAEPVEVPWSDDADWPALTVRALRANREPEAPDADGESADVPHVWIEFACGGWIVYRVSPIEVDEVGDGADDAAAAPDVGSGSREEPAEDGRP